MLRWGAEAKTRSSKMNFLDRTVSVRPCVIHTAEIFVGCALIRSLLTDSNESDPREAYTHELGNSEHNLRAATSPLRTLGHLLTRRVAIVGWELVARSAQSHLLLT